jgi:hypothetical protein
MTITPDQAQNLLDGATPGPWRALHDQWEDEDGTPCEDFYVLGGPDGILHTEDFDPDTHNPVANTTLAAAAPDLAQTIAGMKTEYALETLWGTGADWAVTTGWFPTPERAWADLVLDAGPTRLVRRVVSETEVVES